LLQADAHTDLQADVQAYEQAYAQFYAQADTQIYLQQQTAPHTAVINQAHDNIIIIYTQETEDQVQDQIQLQQANVVVNPIEVFQNHSYTNTTAVCSISIGTTCIHSSRQIIQNPIFQTPQ